MAEAVICASCPESFHDEVAQLCLKYKVQKAFGKAGDMVNALSGKDWIPKWEAKVVMATVTKAQTLNTNKALILCIAGGKNCDAEMARQPALVRAIKTEMNGQDFRVRVEWIDIEEFLERYPGETSRSSKQNGKGSKAEDGKNTKPVKADGKGANSKGTSNPDAKENGKTKENSKTCKFWLEGNCKNGSSCNFLHPKESGKGGYPKGGSPDLKPPNNANQAKGKNADAPATGSSKSGPEGGGSKICKYWLEGNCKNGSNCKFLHSTDQSSADGKGGKGSVAAKGSSKNGTGKGAEGASKPKEPKKDKTNVQCLVCKQKFKDWQSMCSKHFLCQGCPPLCLCLECNKTFADDIDCCQHQCAKGHKGLARVNDAAEPEWSCGECGKTFDTKSACQQHQLSLNHGDFPACSMCGKDFPDLEALAQHQRAKGHVGHLWVLDGASDSEPEALGYEHDPALMRILGPAIGYPDIGYGRPLISSPVTYNSGVGHPQMSNHERARLLFPD